MNSLQSSEVNSSNTATPLGVIFFLKLNEELLEDFTAFRNSDGEEAGNAFLDVLLEALKEDIFEEASFVTSRSGAETGAGALECSSKASAAALEGSSNARVSS